MTSKKYGIGQAVKDVVTGNAQYVSAEVSQKRLATCNTCDKKNKLTNTCVMCGCFIPYKIKFSKASCPAGKWHAVIIR
jgi:hypothetical protein